MSSSPLCLPYNMSSLSLSDSCLSVSDSLCLGLSVCLSLSVCLPLPLPLSLSLSLSLFIQTLAKSGDPGTHPLTASFMIHFEFVNSSVKVMVMLSCKFMRHNWHFFCMDIYRPRRLVCHQYKYLLQNCTNYVFFISAIIFSYAFHLSSVCEKES